MRTILSSLLFTLSINIFGQVINCNFESKEIDEWQQSVFGNWHIDTLNPISGNGSLHHNFDNSSAGTDMAGIQHDILCLDSSNTSWQFSVRYDYNPSGGNNWAVWLTSKQNIQQIYPAGMANGYLIGVNYKGSDDTLRLWKQINDRIEIVCTTEINWQDSINKGDDVWLKVTRTIKGEWAVYIDTTGSDNWKNISNGIDYEMVNSEYFGVYYKYTSSQDRKLWIDDININGFFYRDTFPPTIDSLVIEERNILSVFFSEEIDTSVALNFNLNGMINPGVIEWNNNSSLKITLNKNINEDNKLDISNLTDLKGNIAATLAYSFDYYYPQLYDVIITELLADCSPTVGLPDCEYIEIYNSTSHEINLENWKLHIDENIALLPDYSITPYTYCVLTKASCSSKFTHGEILSVPSMSALPNTGRVIQLRNKYDKLIHALDYSDSWYKSDFKSNGGWSLEMVDLSLPCLGNDNWSESISNTGGTPGQENSVNTQIYDNTAPFVKNLYVVDTNKLKIEFSESLDSNIASWIKNYNVENSNISALSVDPIAPFFKEIVIEFEVPLQQGEIYELKIDHLSLRDCAGNNLEAGNYYFGIPEKPDSASIVINEILFDSTDFIPEFIELYNNSDKLIDLRNYSLAIIDELNNEKKKDILITRENLLFLPGEYLIVTQDKKLLSEFRAIKSNIVEPEN